MAKGEMVMAIEDYFNTQFSASTITSVPDGMGGQTEGVTIEFTFYGVADLISGSKNMVAAQFAEKATHILLCPIGTALKTKHLIADGVSKWRILNIDNPISRGHHLEVILEYIGVA